MSPYYQPSGKFSPLAFVLLAVICVTALPVLAAIYAYGIRFIPIIYVNILLTVGFGFSIGYVTERAVIRPGKVRNPNLATVLGFLAGVVALYLHWAVWIDLLLADVGSTSVDGVSAVPVFGLVFSPATLAGMMSVVNETGTWSLSKSDSVSGWFLSLVWLAEAIVVVGLPTVMARWAAARPFCEVGDAWFSSEELPPFAFIDNKEAVKTDLELGRSSVLDTLSKSTDPADHHSVMTLYSSPNTGHYLTIHNKTASVDKKGKVSHSSDELIEYVSISDKLANRLRAS